MSAVRQNKSKAKRKHEGRVLLQSELCKGCGICVEFCPTHVLGMNKQLNTKGYHTPEIVKPEACTGCDLCGLYCPDFAIHAYRVTSSVQQQDEKGCSDES